jgi:predicted nucleic acid-binding protein
MHHLFIDTDVIIDLLIDRQPFSRETAILFTLAEQKKLKIFSSSLTFCNLYYVLRKIESHQKVIRKLSSLTSIMNILKVDEMVVNNAIKSDFQDFEDSLQYHCALDYRQINAIITRNVRGYRNSELPVMTPADFLKTLK